MNPPTQRLPQKPAEDNPSDARLEAALEKARELLGGGIDVSVDITESFIIFDDAPLEAVAASETITADDLAIRINARD